MAFCKNEVRAKACGQWDVIVPQLARHLADAVDSGLKHPSRHLDCPIHGGKKDLRLFRDFIDTGGGVCTCGTYPDGFALIGAANGWSFSETVNEVGKLVFGTSYEAIKVSRPVRPPRDRILEDAKEDAKKSRRLRNIWRHSTFLPGSLAETYLRSRGISLKFEHLKNLMFCSALENWEEIKKDKWKMTGKYPALIACLHDAKGLPVTLHRIYLQADGINKAPLEQPKKMCGPLSNRTLDGSAVRLCDPKEVLGIAEGIETACAAMQMFRVPCWAAVNADLLEKFVPPKSVKKVIVFADKDRSERGIEAALVLAKRLRELGFEVEIKLPKAEIPEGKKGIDWLDVLNMVQK